MRRWLSLFLLLLALICGGLLGILNTMPATIDLLFFQLQLSLGLALSLALALGLLLGALGLWLFRVLPLRRQVWRLRRELKQSPSADKKRIPLADPKSTPNSNQALISSTPNG